MTEILDFLTECKTFYLATVDGDKPKVRPFGFVMELEGKLYFGTNESKPSFQQLKKNPNIEISATNANNEWLRLSGEAVFDTRPEVKAKVFEVAPHLRGMYDRPDSPVLAPFYVKNGEAIFSSMTAAPRTVKF
ncbi:NimC/NimA family protein [Clostridia bacterium]|nr:NimC/NimA family protein [Clostridia bacterium]